MTDLQSFLKPQTMDEMVEQFTAKMLGLLGLETQFAWKPEALE